MGSREYLSRPEDEVWSESWEAYLHRRTNTAGPVEELWYHGAGCGAWLLVGRDTLTHEVSGASLASAVEP